MRPVNALSFLLSLIAHPFTQSQTSSVDLTDILSPSSKIYEREGTEEALNEAINALQRLRNELDVIRAKYWETRLRAVTRRLADLITSTA